jgi:hypothetical protein
MGLSSLRLGSGQSTQHQYKKSSELPTAMLGIDSYSLATHSALRFPATTSRNLPSKSGPNVYRVLAKIWLATPSEMPPLTASGDPSITFLTRPLAQACCLLGSAPLKGRTEPVHAGYYGGEGTPTGTRA